MTEEEMKGTKEYQLGQAVVKKTWLEDKDKLKPEKNKNVKTVEVYSKTLELLQKIWGTYKEQIPYMGAKEFWEYPNSEIENSLNGSAHVDSNKIGFTLILDIENDIPKTDPSWGTVTKALIRYRELIEYLWKTKYSEIITGRSAH